MRPCIYCKIDLPDCLARDHFSPGPPYCCPRCWRGPGQEKTHPEPQ